ncbi:MEKHLA domain-containing protein [Streptomyces sp. NPDC060030]|uniref:MEKHLA domain-containing protein n=1 Tax=Streptomyces sp. NPDC060030 TaxID=3347042 RepID=UPI00368346E3
MTSLPGPANAEFARLMESSHQWLTGIPLIPTNTTVCNHAEWLYEKAPFGLLVHDTSSVPKFIYANKAAQSFFEFNWGEFIGMPSYLSAPSANQSSRAELMQDVLEKGYTEGYRGLRKAKSGRHFWIESVTIWNLIDTENKIHGQAAAISHINPA